MKHYYVRKILERDQISEITHTIQNANQNDSWVDGLMSGGGTKKVKNNLRIKTKHCPKVNQV